MIRKTYGVSGLMDWTTQIKAGKGSVSVHFTGGALTAYGVTPAKFTTSNPLFQKVIEGSEQFKSGRIELLHTQEVPDDAATAAMKARFAPKAAPAPAPAEEKPAETLAPAPAEEPKTEAAPAVEDGGDEHPQSEDADAGVPVIEVADKSEAVEYLKEHFADKNYTATSLRTKAAFEAACAECGVKFMFTA
jgi:hypothetical protein